MAVRFDRRLFSIVLTSALLASALAHSARGQASDPCWIRGDASDVAQRASKHHSVSLALDGGTIKVCRIPLERR